MIKKISFILFSLICLLLAATTIIEKFQGTQYVQSYIYGSWWFYLLWAALVGVSLIYITKLKLYKRLSVFLLHMSFVCILIGALVTALTATRGSIYLTLGEKTNVFISEEGEEIQLPFEILLDSFDVKYYTGTKAPADYISHVSFIDGGSRISTNISMNNIGKYRAYRFYQSDYDQWGSHLSINKDVYGIPLTYGSYILLALSLIFMLTDPKGAFRKLLNSPLLKNVSMTIVLLLLTFGSANSLIASPVESNLPRTLTKEQAKCFDNLQIVFNERIMPLSTVARNFTLKLVGDDEYKGLNYKQFFFSWLLFPSEWENEPLFEVPLSKKQEFLRLKQISAYSDFFTDKNVYKLNHYIKNTDRKTQPALYKELGQLNEKVQLVAMLRSGAMMKIFPIRDSLNQLQWYSPVSDLPLPEEEGQSIFVKKSFELLLHSYSEGNTQEFKEIAKKIESYQKKFGEESLLSERKMKAEHLYSAIPVTTIFYRLNLTLGLIALIILVLSRNNRKTAKTVSIVLNSILILNIVVLSLYIGLKWYIIGRVPLINGYDTMIFLGCSVAIITFLMRKTLILFSAMGTMLVGFTMLVATIGGLNPQITPLIPVLNSPFLTTHVCFIMLSYALFAFTFINGILALTVGRSDSVLMERITLFSRIFLILAISFLAVGIFIGAVWANVSWGRYWAWDPKEVWALITLIVYCLPLHSKSLKFFNNNKIFHIYLICSIAVVLMTYFGVNLILGGMHSYVA